MKDNKYRVKIYMNAFGLIFFGAAFLAALTMEGKSIYIFAVASSLVGMLGTLVFMFVALGVLDEEQIIMGSLGAKKRIYKWKDLNLIETINAGSVLEITSYIFNDGNQVLIMRGVIRDYRRVNETIDAILAEKNIAVTRNR